VVADSLRLGFLGNGLISWAHSLCLKAMREAGVIDARIVACFDADPARAEQFASVHGAEAVPNAAAVVDAVDVVFVCTPTASHVELVELAASRGRAVFCEKPVGRTLEEARRAAASVREAGVPGQVGLVLRFAPVFAALRALVASGELGRPMAAVFRDDQFFPIQGHYASTWRKERHQTGGGTLIEHSVHDLDVLEHCIGPVRSVAATLECFAGYEGVEDVASVTMRHASGALSSLTSVWHSILSRPSTRRVELFFERGLAWLEDDFLGPLRVQTSDGIEERPCPMPEWVEDLPLPEGDIGLAIRMYAEEDRAFVEAVARGVAPWPSFEDALGAHELVEAAYRSAAAGGVPVDTGHEALAGGVPAGHGALAGGTPAVAGEAAATGGGARALAGRVSVDTGHGAFGGEVPAGAPRPAASGQHPGATRSPSASPGASRAGSGDTATGHSSRPASGPKEADP
jgi:predicted dehydrogenase